MNRRNFFRASASPVLAPLLAPVFSPLRAYAQESKKSDQLTITKVEPYIVRLPPAAGGGRAGGPGGRAGGPGGGRGGGGGEGAGGYPCVRIETAEGIHGWGEGTTPPTTPAVLTQIRESMIRSLVAIYHSRIDYPGYVPPASGQFRITSDDAGSEVTSVIGGSLAQAKFTYRDPADIPVSPGGEIEDEAVDQSRRSAVPQKRSAL